MPELSSRSRMESKEQLKVNFGEQLRNRRLEQGVSLRGLAARAGMEYSHVQRIENGKVNISLTTARSLAVGLNISIAELMRDVE